VRQEGLGLEFPSWEGLGVGYSSKNILHAPFKGGIVKNALIQKIT